MAANTKRLVELGMPPTLAKEVATQIDGSVVTPPVTSVNALTGAVVLDADAVGAVAVPDTPPAYSVDPADLAAALVAAGLMAPDA